MQGNTNETVRVLSFFYALHSFLSLEFSENRCSPSKRCCSSVQFAYAGALGKECALERPVRAVADEVLRMEVKNAKY